MCASTSSTSTAGADHLTGDHPTGDHPSGDLSGHLSGHVSEPGGQPASPTVDVTVGRVSRAHGVRGDVIIDVRTDEPERRFTPGTRFPHPGGVLVVQDVRWHSARLLVRFEGVDDRDGAERLRGIELALQVSADELPEGTDEYYDHQLRGLLAVTTDGTRIGTVADVLHLPSQDVLAIAGEAPEHGDELLIPFVSEMVVEVDLPGGRVVIDDPAGLLAAPPS